MSWARRRVTSVTEASALVEDRGHDDEIAVASRRVRQDRLDRQRRPDDVLAQDVLEFDGLGGRGDVVGREFGQDGVLVEDVVELGFESGQLGVGQPEARQVGDVLDIRAGQGGHGLDDSRRARYDRRMELPVIRPMTPADIEPVAAAFLRENWGDRRLNLEFVTRHDETHPFVADADGVPVGTGVVSVNGPVAWIGTIWVEPAWRRRGVGLELTQATIETAEAAGCRTLVLVATDAGRPMYERLGFEVQTEYRILEAPGLDATDAGPVDPRIRAFEPSDLAAMAALDGAATGEDRAHLLGAFASPESTRVLVGDDGSLGGFVVRAPWGGGATIAPRIEDAEAILHARRVAAGPEKQVRAGLLTDNEAGLERLAASGWTDSWHAPRLIRGDPMRWRPGAIWGQFNHALG